MLRAGLLIISLLLFLPFPFRRGGRGRSRVHGLVTELNKGAHEYLADLVDRMKVEGVRTTYLDEALGFISFLFHLRTTPIERVKSKYALLATHQKERKERKGITEEMIYLPLQASEGRCSSVGRQAQFVKKT